VVERKPEHARASDPVAQRLSKYWKLEVGCAFAVPAVVLLNAMPSRPEHQIAFALSSLACAMLLLIGGFYWKAVLDRALGKPGLMGRLLPIAARARTPSMVLSLAALVVAIALCWRDGLIAPTIAALGLAVLAVLEYVNYYHVQLQNFDHAPDLKRLLATRRLRKAHLARELAALQRKAR
jgi:uncharacterized membrane protein